MTVSSFTRVPEWIFTPSEDRAHGPEPLFALEKIQDSFGGKWGKMKTERPAGVVAGGLISVEWKNGMTAALGKEVRY